MPEADRVVGRSSASFLVTYRPLCSTPAGCDAVRRFGLPPFIDSSCRREPDFQAAAPSISALCRTTKFVPRVWPGDRVVYITGQGSYEGAPGWALVAALVVVERLESHEQAAASYRGRGQPLPSNCIVAGNPPEVFERTSRRAPDEVRDRVDVATEPERAVRLWDAMYAARARDCGVFLVCKAEYLELRRPRVLRRDDLVRIFGRVPGTQNPPKISADEYAALRCYAEQAG